MANNAGVGAGYSIAITVPSGSVLRLSGLGTAQIVPPGVPGIGSDTVPRVIDGGQSSFGPYGVSAVIYVTASASGAGVSYSITKGSDINTANGAQSFTTEQYLSAAPVVLDSVSANVNSSRIDNAVMQAYSAGGGVVSLYGVGPIRESILWPSNVGFRPLPGSRIYLEAAANRAMFRTSNVRMMWDGAAVALTGVQLCYADTATDPGIGTLTYTNSGTTLTWQAPGDTAGTPVNINAGGFFRLPSGTAGRALYVVMATANGGRPGSNKTCSVYVSTLKGAVTASAAVTSNVVTVTETAHGRYVGDSVEIYRPSTGAVVNTEITAITANTYTAAWTVADFTSEAVAVHGVGRVSLIGPGLIDGNRANQTNNSSIEKYGLYLRNASGITIDQTTFVGAYRGIAAYNATDMQIGKVYGSNVGVFCQFEGYTNRVNAVQTISDGVDDIYALTMTNSTVDGTYTWNGSGFTGNIKNVHLGDIHSRANHTCALKITGYTGCTFENITAGRISGNGVSAAVLAVDDTASITGATLKSLNVDKVNWNVTGGTVGEVLNFTMSGGGTSIKLNGINWNGTGSQGIRMSGGALSDLKVVNASSFGSPINAFSTVNQSITSMTVDGDFVLGAAGKVVQTGASASISRLRCSGSWTGNSAAYGVYHLDGVITSIDFSALAATTIRTFYENETTADNAPRISIDGVYSNGTATGINLRYTGGTYNINIGNWSATSIGNNLIQDAASTTMNVKFHGTVDYTGFGSLFAASGTTRTVTGLSFQQSPAFSATPTFRLSQGNIVTPGVMTANITAITLADIPPAGQEGSFVFTQDGTGGRTLAGAFPATVKFPTAAYTDAGNTAGKKTTIKWVSDGTNLIVQGANSWN